MSIETPKPSSENKLNQEPATPQELRDMFHGEVPEVNLEENSNDANIATTPNANADSDKKTERKAPFSERYLNTRPKQVGAAILAATVAIGVPTVAVNIINNNANHNTDHNTDPIQTSNPEATPSATTLNEVTPSVSPTNLTPLETAEPTLTSKEKLIASLELSAEKYPDAKSLAKAIIVDRWTAWENQVATQDVNDEYMNPSTNKTPAALATEKAAAVADVFPKALFVENYKTNATLNHLIETENKIRIATAERTLVTWEDSVPYKRSMNIVGEPELIGGSVNEKMMAFKVKWINTSNAEDNRIGTEYDPSDVNPVTGTYTITAVVTDGNWKIANIQF
jgi:hypothetical protein